MSEKKTPTRLYVIGWNDGTRTYVRATNAPSALRAASRNRATVDVAKPDDMIGVSRDAIIDATADEAQAALPLEAATPAQPNPDAYLEGIGAREATA